MLKISTKYDKYTNHVLKWRIWYTVMSANALLPGLVKCNYTIKLEHQNLACIWHLLTNFY